MNHSVVFMTSQDRRRLALCSGFSALAADGCVGTVERPLFPPDRDEPDFLVVSARRRLRRRHPVVAVDLVEAVDYRARRVYLRGTVDCLGALPEALPLAL
jgi:hypothetical protein